MNLTEVVIRAEDTFPTLKRKVELATILGTIQSTFTHFPYLRKIWQNNTEEERLLGVSLTGIMDNRFMAGKVQTKDETTERDWEEFDPSGELYCLEGVLDALREVAVSTNAIWADRFGIPRSTAITCVKPSGTVSQLVDSASGIHTRHSPYYIRTVRGDNKDPLTSFMKDAGIPWEPCVMKPDSTTVFSFPMKAPEGAITRTDMTAIEQLHMWLVYQRHWCEHKPSVTITVKNDEWMQVGAFVWQHFNELSGVSFLPHSDHIYAQAPYQDADRETYEAFKAKMPERIDWSLLTFYETEDTTSGSQTMACSGPGGCEVVDIT